MGSAITISNTDLINLKAGRFNHFAYMSSFSLSFEDRDSDLENWRTKSKIQVQKMACHLGSKKRKTNSWEWFKTKNNNCASYCIRWNNFISNTNYELWFLNYWESCIKDDRNEKKVFLNSYFCFAIQSGGSPLHTGKSVKACSL